MFGLIATAPNGDVLFDSTTVSLSLLDRIYVIPSMIPGSKYLPDYAGWNLVLAQVQDSPTGATTSDINSFTALKVTVSYDTNQVPTVHWELAGAIGAVQPVEILVLGN